MNWNLAEIEASHQEGSLDREIIHDRDLQLREDRISLSFTQFLLGGRKSRGI